ncbi:MAG: anhydro-N-acetylmuramic acid kinase [Treponema sp.]|jgi:anhydro-N-acetylmuramic acid kinase|nr:anhydro-N-acetylmuramic acid kinase [Treponema sp.]
MHRLRRLIEAPRRIGIGLMSGTSLDGMDAALVEIAGAGRSTELRLLEFLTLPYTEELRSALLETALGETGGSRALCCLNVLLGETAARACLAVCEKAGIPPSRVDFVGSHGQTLYHIPDALPFGGTMVRGTLQLGEAAVIAETLGCPVVSDFRVRDMAAGGQGAPLVPYAEYLLYRRDDETRAFQNIGGIGNITILPAGCGPDRIIAFDTGPGNMIIDALVAAFSGGAQSYDQDGRIAEKGRADQRLLSFMADADEEYLRRPPPKSTGRERYNSRYMEGLLGKIRELDLSRPDAAATAAFYTAFTIGLGVKRFCPEGLKELIVTGGGAHNPVLLTFIRENLPGCRVYAGDDAGINSDAKEAVAFAVLANETIHGFGNNAPSATGASRQVVLGKISL